MFYFWLSKNHISKLEGARESAYLRQVNFYRIVKFTFKFGVMWPGHALFQKIFKGLCLDYPRERLVRFEGRSFNRFGAISI